MGTGAVRRCQERARDVVGDGGHSRGRSDGLAGGVGRGREWTRKEEGERYNTLSLPSTAHRSASISAPSATNREADLSRACLPRGW